MRMIIDPQIEVPQYPKISEDCHIVIEDNKIEIYGVEESLILRGENSLPVFKKILPLLLDGKSSLDVILENVNNDEKDQVPLILKYLYMKGLFEDYSNVTEEDIANQDEAQKYFSRLVDITRLSKNRYEVKDKIEASKIQIITDSILGVDLYNEISEVGFKNLQFTSLKNFEDEINNINNVSFLDKFDEPNLSKNIRNDFHLVCIFNRNSPQVFSIISKIAYSNNQVLTIGFLTDKKAIIGPTFIPDDTGCYECYEQRQTMNMNNLDSYITYKEFLNNNNVHSFSHTNYNKSIFIGLLASEIVNISTLISIPQTIGGELEFDFLRLTLDKRVFYRLPVCKVCSKKATTSSYIFTGEKI